MSGCYGMTACGMGEPKVYGGYGMGATAEQVAAEPPPRPEPVPEPAASDRAQGKPVGCACVETGREFRTVTAAANCYGVSYRTLSRKLLERDEAKVGGLTFKRV